MVARPKPELPLAPSFATLASLRDAAARCRACDLWKRGTQTVFGEGPEAFPARGGMMLVGEQPGDQEDRSGHPFVGPAGRLLDQALAEAGIDRARVYVTNVVKHFKWEPRGKRRLHAKPNQTEVVACRPWLDAEIALVRPRVVVCLGATAAQALLGKAFRVTVSRGQRFDAPFAEHVVATVHPSSLLRAHGRGDDDARHAEVARFVEDLRSAAGLLGRAPAARKRTER